MRYLWQHICLGLLPGILLLLSGLPGWAQCPVWQPANLTGALRTTETYGCVPLSISATTTHIGATNIRYVYEYNRNRVTAPVAASEHQYTKPGEYYLVQYYEVQGNTNQSCVRVVVYDTIPPRVTLTACGTRADLTINDLQPPSGQYDYFVIGWDDAQTDTVQATQPRASHVYANPTARRIRVQGVHKFGRCGGVTTQTFAPNQPPAVLAATPASPGLVRVQIQNTGGFTLSLQTRIGNEAFSAGRPVPPGTGPALNTPADTLLITCFRVVPDGSCPGYGPSPEVCYTPPPPSPQPTAGARLYLPDAFTPNNDGLNDTLKPIGEAPTGTYQLTIFDRWGRVVFSGSDVNQAWDGTTGGTRMAVGVYTYQLETSQLGGQIRQQSGRLQLLR